MDIRKNFLIALIVSALILVCVDMACTSLEPERPEGIEFDQETQGFVFTLTEPGLTKKEYEDQWDAAIAETKRKFYSKAKRAPVTPEELSITGEVEDTEGKIWYLVVDKGKITIYDANGTPVVYSRINNLTE